MARRTDNLNPTPYERASLERQARRASKQFNANSGRGIPVSPNDRRLPGAMANVQATPQAEPVVMTPDQLAPINEKFANKGIFAGDPSTVPFSDVTEDARRFAQTDMRTPTQRMAAKPPTPATPQDKAAVLLNMYRESLMPQMPATPGGPMPPKAPADAKSFLNTPSYDMDYGTIQELQKTREGKIALADIQERQKRFTKSITAIATQMGLGEIGRSDEGMQEFYERAIYGNPEYSPLIAGFAKGMFMKTMPPNIGRQMERERADAEKRTRAEAQNKWNEEHGIEKRYDPWGNEYSPPKPVEEKPTIREIIAQQKQAADEKMAALQELYPDKKFKINPVTGVVSVDETEEDTFNGSDLYNRIETPSKKAEVRDNISLIEDGGVMDASGKIVDPDELKDDAERTAAKARTDKYLKRWKGDEQSQLVADVQANYDNLIAQKAFYPIKQDPKTGLWEVEFVDRNGNVVLLGGVPLDESYVTGVR